MMNYLLKDFETSHFKFINYVNMIGEQSRVIWQGRNDIEVRKWMVNPEPFPFETHQKFVESLNKKEDRSYWCVCVNNANACESESCNWGGDCPRTLT